MADVVKQGWLTKSPPPGAMKGWKRRYFRFRKASDSGRPRLEYFASLKEVEKNIPKGIIDLSTCQAIEPGLVDNAKQKFVFKIVIPGRIFQLMAASEMDMNQWIGAICSEIFKPKDAAPFGARPQSQAPQQAHNVALRASVRPKMAPPSSAPAPQQAPPRRESFVEKKRPAHLGGPRSKPHHPKPLGTYPWLYGKLSRQQAEGLLTDYGLTSGLFLVRQSASKPGAHAVSVCHRGRIVHHLVTLEEGRGYFLNGKQCGSCTSIGEVVEFLKSKRGEPLNWRTALRACPSDLDSNPSAISTPTSSAPSTTPSTTATSPQRPSSQSEPQLISAFVRPSPQSEALGFIADGACKLKCSSQGVNLMTLDLNVVCQWPFPVIENAACDSSSLTLKIDDSHDHPGEFVFNTTSGAAFLALVQPHLIIREAPKPSVAPRKPATAPKPDPPKPYFEALAEQSNPTQSKPEHPDDDYEINEPPSTELKTSPSVKAAGFSADHLAKMQNLLATQGSQMHQGPPPVVARSSKPDLNESEGSPSKSATLPPKTVKQAMPGISGMSADSILKARGDLKKSATIEKSAHIESPPVPSRTLDSGSDAPPPRPAKSIPSDSEAPPRPQKIVEEVAEVVAEPPDEPEEGEQWIAGCDYEANGAVDKLSFEEGDVLTVTFKDDGGWWFAKLGTQEGWVPADFLDPLHDAEDSSSEEEDDPDAPVTDLIAEAMKAVSEAEATLNSLGTNSAPGLPPKNDKAYLNDSDESPSKSGLPASDTPQSSADATPPPIVPRHSSTLRPCLRAEGAEKSMPPRTRSMGYEDMSDVFNLKLHVVQDAHESEEPLVSEKQDDDVYDEDDPSKVDDQYETMAFVGQVKPQPNPSNSPNVLQHQPEKILESIYLSVPPSKVVEKKQISERAQTFAKQLGPKVRELPNGVRARVLSRVSKGQLSQEEAVNMIMSWESGVDCLHLNDAIPGGSQEIGQLLNDL